MTNATETKTKTFTIHYPVTLYTLVSVERDANISEEELLASISKDDLVNGSEDDDGAWEDLKCVWRDATPGDLTITDEDGDYVYQEDPFLNA